MYSTLPHRLTVNLQSTLSLHQWFNEPCINKHTCDFDHSLPFELYCWELQIWWQVYRGDESKNNYLKDSIHIVVFHIFPVTYNILVFAYTYLNNFLLLLLLLFKSLARQSNSKRSKASKLQVKQVNASYFSRWFYCISHSKGG